MGKKILYVFVWIITIVSEQVGKRESFFVLDSSVRADILIYNIDTEI
jgi:hypothetical protein